MELMADFISKSSAEGSVSPYSYLYLDLYLEAGAELHLKQRPACMPM